MRPALAALLGIVATPAFAWNFTPGQPCVLTHETPDLAIRLTYDPTKPLYSIALTRREGFTPADTFSMRFHGPQPIRIATDRHQLSADRTSLVVINDGFGNVLDGLEFNASVTATLGTQVMMFSLTGAATPVAAFRTCEVIVPSS